MSEGERQRYQRQLLLPQVGEAGQQAIREAKVVVVGVGGLGTPAATYLAAAGVGTLGLVEHDIVDISNLHRQVLYTDADLGEAKLGVAAERLQKLNPSVHIEAHDAWLRRENVLEILAGYDIVVNGCDNFPTRYLVNDACVLLGKPLVDGGVHRFEGQVTVYDTGAGGPCYRCRYPAPPQPELAPNCAEAGVLGVVPGIVGVWQAAEALKLILRDAGSTEVEPLVGRVLLIDVLAGETLEVHVRRDPACAVCGDAPTITEPVDTQAFCRGRAADVSEIIGRIERDPGAYEVTAPELARRLTDGEPVVLVDVREPREWELCRIEGAQLVPLSQLEERWSEIPRDRPVVTYCHAGVRSLAALARLAAEGYDNVRSLAGGIDAWSRLVDPSVPRY